MATVSATGRFDSGTTSSSQRSWPAQQILATANTVSIHRGPFCPRLRKCRTNSLNCDTFDKLILASIELYTDVRKIPDFTKKDQVSWMCFIIANDLYTAHHISLGIFHQLKLHHLYGTFLDPVYKFVWGPEDCFAVFMERRVIRRNRIYDSENCSS